MFIIKILFLLTLTYKLGNMVILSKLSSDFGFIMGNEKIDCFKTMFDVVFTKITKFVKSVKPFLSFTDKVKLK